MLYLRAAAFIGDWEGLSLSPYKCPAGVWTIGYGETRMPDGTPVTNLTPDIDKDTAVRWLMGRIEEIHRDMKPYVRVPLLVCQEAALLSFCYNLGVGAFAASTLRQRLNREDYDGAADEFRKWVYARGRILRGLVRRRRAEKELFLEEYN